MPICRLIPNRELRELIPNSYFTTTWGRRGIVISQRSSEGITVVDYDDTTHWVDNGLPVKCGWVSTKSFNSLS